MHYSWSTAAEGDADENNLPLVHLDTADYTTIINVGAGCKALFEMKIYQTEGLKLILIQTVLTRTFFCLYSNC